MSAGKSLRARPCGRAVVHRLHEHVEDGKAKSILRTCNQRACKLLCCFISVSNVTIRSMSQALKDPRTQATKRPCSESNRQQNESARFLLVQSTPLIIPPPTINLDGGDDCPPHKRPPSEGHLLRGGVGGVLTSEAA